MTASSSTQQRARGFSPVREREEIQQPDNRAAEGESDAANEPPVEAISESDDGSPPRRRRSWRKPALFGEAAARMNSSGEAPAVAPVDNTNVEPGPPAE